jgi:hypothetical protein
MTATQRLAAPQAARAFPSTGPVEGVLLRARSRMRALHPLLGPIATIMKYASILVACAVAIIS